MMDQKAQVRRSLLSGIGAAAAAFALGSKAVTAQAQTAAGDGRPLRHDQDAWLDQLPTGHRSIIDCATVNGAGEGILYANNLYVANRDGYQLDEKQVGVVVCLRHFATVFAFDDAVWAKYGKVISDLVQFTDPKTRQAPSTNLLNSAEYGMMLPNFGNTIASVVGRGTHFAVCNMASHFIASQVSTAIKADASSVYDDLTSNLVPNSHMVAAGVVAVNRAQEHGYSLLTAL